MHQQALAYYPSHTDRTVYEDHKTSIEETSLAHAFGLDFPGGDLDSIANDLTLRALDGIRTRVAFVNAHCINEMFRCREYDRSVRSADMVLPDGSGIALASLLASGKMSTNLNGTDLAPKLFAYANIRPLSIYLLGARPEVVEQVAENVERAYRNVRISGTRDGYFTPAENDDVIADINRADPDILLVAMGVPYQDIWLARNHDRLNAPVVLGVGGLFDFLSQRIPRAPRALRATGLEWTWRLAQEPARMWRRYILGNPAFVCRSVVDATRSHVRKLADRLKGITKRCLDITVSATALSMLSPLLIGVAIAVRKDSPGPALFRQTRVGRNGETFTMYKFRSMRPDAEALRENVAAINRHGSTAITFKCENDPRITRLGRFIRKYSIDELPQLFNVLKGDMSLVGPRPALPSEVEKYDDMARNRLRARPGLTCIWQISGRGDLPFDRQLAMDISYISRQSFWLDLWILLKTPFAVLSARGAY